jgi:hypothetical protein
VVSTNSSDVASFRHDKAQRQVVLSPSNEGSLQVRIKDLGVEEEETAEATLFVSDISTIELLGGGLIEEGNNVNVSVKVFDAHGHQFKRGQLEFMTLEPTFEGIGSVRSGGLKIKKIAFDKFNIVGAKSGSFRVTVSAKKHDKVEVVSSNFVRIEVFPFVKLVPEDLLIFPGGRWTIQVEGGPESRTKTSVKKRFKVSDESVCEINEDGEVLGKRVGSTTLTLQMDYSSGDSNYPLATRSIKVRVRLITAIEVPSMND